MKRAHGHGGEGHSHSVRTDADRRYLVIALLLLAAFMVTEVIVAVVSGSLVLLSDAGHMLSDVGAIGGALWAIKLAARPAAGAWTYGWNRAEILSAALDSPGTANPAEIGTLAAAVRLSYPSPTPGLNTEHQMAVWRDIQLFGEQAPPFVPTVATA